MWPVGCHAWCLHGDMPHFGGKVSPCHKKMLRAMTPRYYLAENVVELYLKSQVFTHSLRGHSKSDDVVYRSSVRIQENKTGIWLWILTFTFTLLFFCFTPTCTRWYLLTSRRTSTNTLRSYSAPRVPVWLETLTWWPLSDRACLTPSCWRIRSWPLWYSRPRVLCRRCWCQHS